MIGVLSGSSGRTSKCLPCCWNGRMDPERLSPGGWVTAPTLGLSGGPGRVSFAVGMGIWHQVSERCFETISRTCQRRMRGSRSLKSPPKAKCRYHVHLQQSTNDSKCSARALLQATRSLSTGREGGAQSWLRTEKADSLPRRPAEHPSSAHLWFPHPLPRQPQHRSPGRCDDSEGQTRPSRGGPDPAEPCGYFPPSGGSLCCINTGTSRTTLSET